MVFAECLLLVETRLVCSGLAFKQCFCLVICLQEVVLYDLAYCIYSRVQSIYRKLLCFRYTLNNANCVVCMFQTIDVGTV